MNKTLFDDMIKVLADSQYIQVPYIFSDNTDCAGLCIPAKRVMLVQSGIAHRAKQYTALHEFIHAYDDIEGLPMSERDADGRAQATWLHLFVRKYKE